MKSSVKIGIIQCAPVYFDVKGSMEKAAGLMKEAVDKGAELIVFGETWFTGYPNFLDTCPDAALWNHGPTKEIFARMYKNSITVPGDETRVLCDLAKTHGVVICIGINERVETGIGNGTIFNSLLLIDSQGNIANHHRKLMPTYTERLVYGIGDGNGLQAVDTPLGRVGSLICWEHWMPLTRQAMHNSGEHIHIAVWPSVHDVHQLASRHYAFEGRCYVVAVGQIMHVSDYPKELKLPEHMQKNPEKMALNGGSCIFGPDGACLLEPQFDKEGVIIHEIEDLEKTVRERITLDVSGHYNRADVFDFTVNKQRKA